MQPGHSAENALELDDSEDEQIAIVVELPRASAKVDERASFNPVQDLHGFPSDDGVAHSPSSRALRYEASSPALRLVQSDTKSQDGKTEESGLRKIASRQSPSTSAAQLPSRKSYFGAEADKWKSSFRTSKVTRSGVSLNRCEWRKAEGTIFEPAELCNKTFASGEALACHVLTTHSQDVNGSNGKVRLNAQSSPTTAKDQALHIERAHSKASVDQLRPFATVVARPLHSMSRLAQSVSKAAFLLQQISRDKLSQWQHDSVVLLAERSAQVKLGQASRMPRRARAQLVPSQSLVAALSESDASDEDEEEQDEVDSWSATIAGLDSREPRAEPVRVPQLEAPASMENFVIYVDQPKSGVSNDLRQHHRLVQKESISELTLDAAAVMDPKRWLRNVGQSVSHGDSRFHELTRPAYAQEALYYFEGDSTSTTTSSSLIAPRRSHVSLDGAPQSAASPASSSPPSSPFAPMQLLRAPRSVQLAHAANAKKRMHALSRHSEDDNDDSNDESVRSGVALAGRSSIVHRTRRRRITCSSDDEA